MSSVRFKSITNKTALPKRPYSIFHIPIPTRLIVLRERSVQSEGMLSSDVIINDSAMTSTRR